MNLTRSTYRKNNETIIFTLLRTNNAKIIINITIYNIKKTNTILRKLLKFLTILTKEIIITKSESLYNNTLIELKKIRRLKKSIYIRKRERKRRRDRLIRDN